MSGIITFLSDIGGLWALIYEVGAIFIELLAYDLFIASFMKSLFTVKSIKPRKEEKKNDSDENTITDISRRNTNLGETETHRAQRQAVK